MKNKKTAVSRSLLALLLCIAMLIGTTFAWFTDSVTSSQNVITAGKLDLEMYWTDDTTSGQWYNVEDPAHNTIFGCENWEPGYTDVRYIKIVNKGNLALNYKLSLTPQNEVGELAEVINVYFAEEEVNVRKREDLESLGAIGLLSNVVNGGSTADGTILPAGQVGAFDHASGETIVTIAMSMVTTAGNKYQGKDTGDFTITAVATQASFEKDSFGADYDTNALYPDVKVGGKVVSTVKNVGGKLANSVTMKGEGITAYLPAGVALDKGTDKLTLTVTPLDDTSTGLTVINNEKIIPYDIHIGGISKNNTVPIIIDLGEVMPKYLNMGNYRVYHVEDGQNSLMTLVDSREDLTAHNQFTYDTLTGEVSVAMASFSEVALVADTSRAWKGEYDYSWYTNSKARSTTADYTIANADQLAAFGAIVGGMNDQTRDSFAGKTVKLLSDINLGDKNGENESLIFYPIGYYYNGDSSSPSSTVYQFSGTFDGNGHTISSFYQNTWEIKGDYDGNYYKDAMGLFGYVVNGTVANLTVDNFSSDGEFTPTGVVAAYAVNSTFENIAINNCNPRVYNTGNGGIIGIAGNTNDKDTIITLKNITVDNSNKISALWGSWDVACGGLVGMFRGNADGGNGKIHFENCHVASQIDVYNDVCANYQYYAYRYSGMIIGSVRHNTKDKSGRTIPDMTGISAKECTVKYGEWCNYYYCEYEKNSMASYSEDYQFSRVDKSEIVFDENGNAIGCTHTHTDAEDKRAVFLPFYQLFTGYSWGVSSIGLEKYNGIVTELGITEGNFDKPLNKFNAKDIKELANNKEYKLSEIFEFVSDVIPVVHSGVTVAVNNLEDNNPVSAEYKRDNENWENSTIEFDGTGEVELVIQDYYFCEPTKVNVTVTARKEAPKFANKFKDDFLYRVGNANAVALGSLFEGINGTTINNETVKVSFSEATGDVSGVYTDNKTDWTNDTIKFSGTGVVKVTITDDNYCTPTELYLEVVDATNIVNYSELKDGQNSVLLKDIEMSNGGTYRLTGNHVLYGNDFVFDVTKGAYAAVQYDYMSYVIYLENSRLDNVQVKGAVYPEVGATKDNNYNRAIVMTNGDCSIVNSMISNGASPIRNGGNLELVNTTLKGGAYANLDLRNGHLILDNVTTINQIGSNEKYNNTTEIVGMGIVVYQEGGSEQLKITIRNNLKQYNYLSQSQANTCFTDSYAKQIKNIVFGSDFESYKNGEWINFGIISMNDYFGDEDLVDERVDKAGYYGTEKKITAMTVSRNCFCYSFRPTSTTPPIYSDYKTMGQGAIKPNVVFDFTEKNYVKPEQDKNDYCYADGRTVYISMDEGDSFSWDTSILTATKYDATLKCEVKVDGVDYTNKSVIFNETGSHTVVYSFTDTNNYQLEDGKVVAYDVTYTETVYIEVAVVKAAAKNAVFSFGENGTAYKGKFVVIGDKTYVMPDVTAEVSGKVGSKSINGTKVYYPIVEMETSDSTTEHTGSWYACFPIFKNALQIVDYADEGTGEELTYNQTTVKKVANIPSTLKATDPAKTFLYSMNATNYPAPTEPMERNNAVYYTCNRKGLDSGSNYPRKEETIVAEYTYTDNVGVPYTFYIGYHCAEQTKGSTGCVTPDTLITLADGSQKRVDSLTGKEELLVWNLKTGKYDKAPIVFVDTEEEMEYEIIHLYFSDGSDVKVISEHGFFDLDLGKYVYIDAQNYADYVGHKFVKEGNISANEWDVVTLKKVVLEKEVTTAWSPVTFEHLCYYTNGVLSMPGGIEGLFNIFEVDTDTMSYDAQKMQKDIETYGLFTIDDFGGLITEDAFNAFNGAYLKVAIGKGILTWEEIARMAERYIPLM